MSNAVINKQDFPINDLHTAAYCHAVGCRFVRAERMPDGTSIVFIFENNDSIYGVVKDYLFSGGNVNARRYKESLYFMRSSMDKCLAKIS